MLNSSADRSKLDRVFVGVDMGVEEEAEFALLEEVEDLCSEVASVEEVETVTSVVFGCISTALVGFSTLLLGGDCWVATVSGLLLRSDLGSARGFGTGEGVSF